MDELQPSIKATAIARVLRSLFNFLIHCKRSAPFAYQIFTVAWPYYFLWCLLGQAANFGNQYRELFEVQVPGQGGIGALLLVFFTGFAAYTSLRFIHTSAVVIGFENKVEPNSKRLSLAFLFMATLMFVQQISVGLSVYFEVANDPVNSPDQGWAFLWPLGTGLGTMLYVVCFDPSSRSSFRMVERLRAFKYRIGKKTDSNGDDLSWRQYFMLLYWTLCSMSVLEGPNAVWDKSPTTPAAEQPVEAVVDKKENLWQKLGRQVTRRRLSTLVAEQPVETVVDKKENLWQKLGGLVTRRRLFIAQQIIIFATVFVYAVLVVGYAAPIFWVTEYLESYSSSYVIIAVLIYSAAFHFLQMVGQFPYFVKTYSKYKLRVPTLALMGLALLSAFVGLFRMPDNRRLTYLPMEDRTLVASKVKGSIQSHYSDGISVAKALDNRLVAQKSQKELPLIVVAAEGGGIHAAYRSARILAAISDLDPGFWDNTFCVSGTSGGAVGSSLAYLAHLSLAERVAQCNRTGNKDNICVEEPASPESDLVKKAIDTDCLSIVFGRGVFTEPLGLVDPLSNSFDRGRGLELEYERMVKKLDSDYVTSYSQTGIMSHKYIAPELLGQDAGNEDSWIQPFFAFNTTAVPTGRRFVLTPLKINGELCSSDENYNRDIPFEAAACASARFPIFPGAGRYSYTDKNQKDLNYYLLDGGVDDNSGIGTAESVVSDIKKWALFHPTVVVRVMLVVIGNRHVVDANPDPSGFTDSADGLWAYFQGVIASTLYKNSDAARRLPPAISREDLNKVHPLDPNNDYSDDDFKTGGSPGELALENSSHITKLPGSKLSLKIIDFPWCGDAISPPLGWYLSDKRKAAMDYNMGLDEWFFEHLRDNGVNYNENRAKMFFDHIGNPLSEFKYLPPEVDEVVEPMGPEYTKPCDTVSNPQGCPIVLSGDRLTAFDQVSNFNFQQYFKIWHFFGDQGKLPPH